MMGVQIRNKMGNKKYTEAEIFKRIEEWFGSLEDETEDGEYAAASTLITGNKLCEGEDILKLKKKFMTPGGFRKLIEKEGLTGVDFT